MLCSIFLTEFKKSFRFYVYICDQTLNTMIFNNFFGNFSTDLGLDLGTGSTLMSLKSKGIVINEPSVVAVNNRTDQIISIGGEASKMLGKTPPYIQAVRPLTHGVISVFEVTE